MPVSRNAPCPCGATKNGAPVKYKACCLEKTKLVPSSGKRKVNGPALAILMPTRGRITVETMTALNFLDGVPGLVIAKSRMGVVDARNALVTSALAVEHNAPYEPTQWYALWVDDDAFWRPGTITRMLDTLAKPGVDILAGWFSGRCELSSPKAFRDDGSSPVVGVDCEIGNILQVKHVGFHFVMHTLDILKKMPENPFTITGEGTEDAAFCDRAAEAGFKVWVDTAAMIAHVDDDGFAYLPGCEKMLVQNGQLIKNTPLRRYGAGVDDAVAAAV